ncbi:MULTISPECIES: DMT family transporter [unclassified Haladaptatus]|uniref:DMT family transporter n=1 Tax=unclassified Haladaptatus TaxID=2622732 RepID=UPI00209BF9E0|nr:MULTISPECIES: DMT family transporter [unclassified Haladaptatus]MCO8243991.1 DMT family transporter [Haladaptatus sp. AB643]MCO8256526.1 DMT family transporter [Haladaptatus sp. AB618]
MIPSRYRNSMLFALLAVIWGSSFVAIKAGLHAFPPVLFAAFRYDVAGAALLTVVVGLGLRNDDFQWRPTTRTDWTLVGVGGTFMFGAYLALLFTGQQYVTSGVGAVILSLKPVVTPLFALALLPNERFNALEVVGVLLALVGVVVVADPTSLGGSTVGIALLLVAALVFAFASVVTQRLRTTLPALTQQAWMMVVGALVLHATSAAIRGWPSVSFTRPALVSLVYLAFVASIGGYVIYFDLLERVGANEVNLVNYAVPVAATLFGWALLGEPITDATVSGFLVIVAGFVLLKWATLKRGVVAAQRPSRRVPQGGSETVVVSGNVYYRG